MKFKKQFCPKGHDKNIVGIDAQGHCRSCISLRYIPVVVDKRRTQFCSQGHDKNLVGRDNKGACIRCRTERKIQWDKEHKEEIIEYMRIWREEHKTEISDLIRKWKIEHPEYDKLWRKAHPEAVSSNRIKHTTNRSLRIVSWTDWPKINEFEKRKPQGMTIDHYIPLQGEEVSGLHVSWNLQYMLGSLNSSKSNLIDLVEASKWYGKILEKIGLK